MKIINIEMSNERWSKLKRIADAKRRHIKQQAGAVLDDWVDKQEDPAAPCLWLDDGRAQSQGGRP